MPAALSILQPWAALIVAGLKNVENRTWSTSFRGRLLVHASKARKGVEHEAAACTAEEAGWHLGGIRALAGPWMSKENHHGAIIGSVEVVDCVRAGDQLPPSKWANPADGTWWWMLRDPRVFAEPIPWKGKLGIWQYAHAVDFGVPANWVDGYGDRKCSPIAEVDTGEVGISRCPSCRMLVADFDGFGCVAHVGDSYANPCGYCSHPSRDGGKCTICGEVNSDG